MFKVEYKGFVESQDLFRTEDELFRGLCDYAFSHLKELTDIPKNSKKDVKALLNAINSHNCNSIVKYVNRFTKKHAAGWIEVSEQDSTENVFGRLNHEEIDDLTEEMEKKFRLASYGNEEDED